MPTVRKAHHAKHDECRWQLSDDTESGTLTVSVVFHRGSKCLTMAGHREELPVAGSCLERGCDLQTGDNVCDVAAQSE